MQIRMKNWKCFPDVHWKLGTHTFVFGVNGSGKTSIRDVFEFVYEGTGKLSDLRTKKALAAECIRDHQRTCEAAIELGGVRQRRTMDLDGAQEVFRSKLVDGKWTAEEPVALKRSQGSPFGKTPDDMVRAMLEPTYFLQELEPERRQEILIQATSSPGATRDQALQALMEALEIEESDDLQALEDAALWVSEKGFRGAQEAAEEQRLQAGRERDQVIVGEAPEPVVQLNELEVDLADATTEAHQARLGELRQRLKEAIRRESAGAGALAGQLQEAEQQLEALKAEQQDVSTFEQGIAKARKAVAELEENPVGYPTPAPEEPDDTKARAVAERLQQTRATVTKLQEKAQELEAQKKDPAAYKRPTECPKGPPGMKCPVQPKTFAAKVAAALGDPARIDAELDAIRGELVNAQELVVDLQRADEKERQELEAARKAVRSHQDLVEAADRHLRALEDARERVRVQEEGLERVRESGRNEKARKLQELEARLGTLRQALQDAQESDEPTGPSVQDLEAKIAVGESVVEASRDFWREQKAYEKREAERARLEGIWKRWDAIVQQLKPTGIETKLGGNARERFHELLAKTEAFAGEIRLDDECQISIRLPGGEVWRTLAQLSTSQELAVGVAIQHALCTLEGWPILICDSIDLFDADHRRGFIAFAEQEGGTTYEAVIGLATVQKEPTAPPQPWSTLWLREHDQVLLHAEAE